MSVPLMIAAVRYRSWPWRIPTWASGTSYFRCSGDQELPIAFRGRSFTRRTLRFAWHLTTVAWLGLAGQLVVLASPSGDGVRSLAQVIAGTFAVSGVVSLFGSRGRHPSWVVFFIVALLVWLAYR